MTATDLNGVVRIIQSQHLFPEASRPSGVLVASSDFDTRLLLAHHLEKLGFGVWTVSSGADAFQTAIEHPVSIDMLLCDETISDIPAPQLYAKLKARTPGLRCCVLATTPQQLRASEAARLGAVVLDVTRRGLEMEEERELAAAKAW